MAACAAAQSCPTELSALEGTRAASDHQPPNCSMPMLMVVAVVMVAVVVVVTVVAVVPSLLLTQPPLLIRLTPSLPLLTNST